MEDVNQCKINALPDSILLQVLSLLPIKDAVKTSVLSRRWSHLWSFMPTINFNEDDFSSKMKAELVTIVDRHLVRHAGGVRCFNLSVNFARVGHAMHVHRWISHLAVTRKVEVVKLLLHASAKCINLRLNSFDCSSIVALELKGCYFESPLSGSVVLGSLKTLTLRDMTLLGSKLLSMLQGCPLLQCLNMENCSKLGDVNISLLHLTNLTITLCEDMKLLEIDTPQLEYFKFHCYGWKLNESGVSKLVAALTHLKALKACGCFLQALSSWWWMIEYRQFSNLEELDLLECERKKFSAKIPYLLLKCCPGLRKIIINKLEHVMAESISAKRAGLGPASAGTANVAQGGWATVSVALPWLELSRQLACRPINLCLLPKLMAGTEVL
ncbi:FBD-associated F-box protein [Nymphaea thermarum]|nr:FBD-associated F-box protein [Nymphaea thermarum]